MSVIKTLGMLLPLRLFDEHLRINCNITQENHRWCIIHSLMNFFIMCFSTRGMMVLLSSDNTIENNTHSFNLNSSVIVLSIHTYHILFFEINQLSLWMHHIIMTLVQLIPFFHSDDQSFLLLTDYMLFFLCGLPGMIDYYCMHLVYKGTMPKLQEKQINNILNTYIRAPGILYGAFYIYRQYMNNIMTLMSALPTILSFLWNAQFFSNAVAISYGYNMALEDNKIKN